MPPGARTIGALNEADNAMPSALRVSIMSIMSIMSIRPSSHNSDVRW